MANRQRGDVTLGMISLTLLGVGAASNNRAEWRNNVRTMVSKIFRGGHVLTTVEESIEGRWKAGLDNGRYTREQGLLWVRLAEKATDAEVLGSTDKAPRSLTEAISAIVTADVLGRRCRRGW